MAQLIPYPLRKACPKCGEPLFRDCNSDETVFFWSCPNSWCDYSEKPSARQQAFDQLQELQKHPHTVRTVK